MPTETECESTAQHYATLARQPGWWHYTPASARDGSGRQRRLQGLYARVRALLGDFRPGKEEANWEWS